MGFSQIPTLYLMLTNQAKEGDRIFMDEVAPNLTVNLDGKLRNIQGLPITEVPYTLENQANYPQAVLNHILK